MDNQVEHIFRKALGNYNNGSDKRKNYAVCWYAYLLSVINAEYEEAYSDKDENIYRIRANSRQDAVKIFLTMKAKCVQRTSEFDYKKEILNEIVENTYKYGRMRCLEAHPDLKSFSYDIETVLDGEYYSIDRNDERDMAIVRAEAVLKNVDHESVNALLTPELFTDVFVEAHLYDVAVIELESIDE